MVKSMCGIQVTRVMSTLIRHIEILTWNLSGGLSHVRSQWACCASVQSALRFRGRLFGSGILLLINISKCERTPIENVQPTLRMSHEGALK
jgi:hypothetical protein